MSTHVHPRRGPLALLSALRVLAFAVLLTVTLGAGTAHAAPGHDLGTSDWRDDLLRGIVLSDAQRARIDSIQSVYSVRLAAQRRASAGTSEEGAAWAVWLRLQREQRNAIRAALTPDQQRTFDSNAEGARERMRSEIHRVERKPRWWLRTLLDLLDL